MQEVAHERTRERRNGPRGDGGNQRRTYSRGGTEPHRATLRPHDLADAFAGVTGPGGVTDLVALLRTAMPDLHFATEDIFGAVDRTFRYTATGTQRGMLLGRPPT